MHCKKKSKAFKTALAIGDQLIAGVLNKRLFIAELAPPVKSPPPKVVSPAKSASPVKDFAKARKGSWTPKKPINKPSPSKYKSKE